MPNDELTLLDDGRAVALSGHFTTAGVRLRPEEVHDVLGWELKPEGLCRAGICIPVRGEPELSSADGVDLAALSRVLSRPLALDVDERVAYLGTAASERAAQLASLQAPEFTLPDLAGQPHSLSDYRGRKVLLIAYASW